MKLLPIELLSLCMLVIALVFADDQATAQIVYQDSFDNDGNDINAGIGGGFVSGESSGLSFLDDGEMSAGVATAGFARVNVSSENSFNLANGFTLEVTYRQETNTAGAPSPPFPSNHFSLGLATVSAMDTEEFLSTDTFVPDFDGIGFSLGTRAGNVTEGLLQSNLDSDYTVLEDFNANGPQSETFGPNPIAFVLTVQANGTYEFTLGALSGSGTTTLNLDQEFFFRGRTQGSNGNSVQSITLTQLSGDGCPGGFDIGDVNQDGMVDLLDVGPFIAALTNGSDSCEADVNEDGTVDLLDVGPFVDLLSGG